MKLRPDPGLYSGRMPGDYITIEVNGREADQAAVSLLEHEGWAVSRQCRSVVAGREV